MNINSYHITTILIYLIIPIVVSLPLFFRKETAHKKNTFVYPKFGVVVGILVFVGITAMNIFLMCISNDPLAKKIWLGVLFQSFSLLGVASILIGLNLRIELHKEEMIYRNFLGISRRCKYIDIENDRKGGDL